MRKDIRHFDPFNQNDYHFLYSISIFRNQIKNDFFLTFFPKTFYNYVKNRQNQQIITNFISITFSIDLFLERVSFLPLASVSQFYHKFIFCPIILFHLTVFSLYFLPFKKKINFYHKTLFIIIITLFQTFYHLFVTTFS